MSLQIITTAGMIDKVHFDAKSEYEVGPPQFAGILREANVTFEFAIEPVLRQNSMDLTAADRGLIRARIGSSPCPRVPVTHGKDTMVDTARGLLGIPGKTIVLTGSMPPARFRNKDAVFNADTAIGAVQTLPPGVDPAMNSRISDPATRHENAARHAFDTA